ncbi:MAG: hypothetical protein IJG60_04620 [Thermoguttaceae bacterium]|nr:hypothetical protein [Thermoguttaceae bacterium]
MKLTLKWAAVELFWDDPVDGDYTNWPEEGSCDWAEEKITPNDLHTEIEDYFESICRYYEGDEWGDFTLNYSDGHGTTYKYQYLTDGTLWKITRKKGNQAEETLPTSGEKLDLNAKLGSLFHIESARKKPKQR